MTCNVVEGCGFWILRVVVVENVLHDKLNLNYYYNRTKSLFCSSFLPVLLPIRNHKVVSNWRQSILNGNLNHFCNENQFSNSIKQQWKQQKWVLDGSDRHGEWHYFLRDRPLSFTNPLQHFLRPTNALLGVINQFKIYETTFPATEFGG